MRFIRGRFDRRPERPSRCLTASNAPQTLHWAVIEGNRKYVIEELKREVMNNLPVGSSPALTTAVVQDVRAVLEAMESCRARDPEDVKNLARCRDLFEIRVEVAVNGLLIRIYETEIAELPKHIVLLLAHVKLVRGMSQDAIAREQNRKIDEAISRWHRGRSDLWGLPV